MNFPKLRQYAFRTKKGKEKMKKKSFRKGDGLAEQATAQGHPKIYLHKARETLAKIEKI